MEFNMELKEAKEYLNSKGYELIDEGLWQKFKDKVNETGTKFDIMVRKEILGSSSPDAEEGKEGAIFYDKRRQFLLDLCDVAKEYGYKNFGEKVSKACNNKELATVLAKLCVQYFKDLSRPNYIAGAFFVCYYFLFYFPFHQPFNFLSITRPSRDHLGRTMLCIMYYV